MNRRLWELDALRGLMLVLMTVTHLPTRFSDPLGQPFGHVSAAEGFVMLSGLMAGMVYTARARRDGEDVVREAFLKRAWKIYLCQAALLVFLFTVAAFIGVVSDQKALTGLIDFYLSEPLTAVISSLLLIHSPPLMDILPMYILFMLASPVLLLHGLQHGWRWIMAGSIALWLAGQFDLGLYLYEAVVDLTGLPVPVQQTGSFELFGWQFLWVMGLWLGSSRAAVKNPAPIVFPRWMVYAAIAIGIVGLVWRHGIGQVPFPAHAELNPIFDKWHLGPLRLINFFALMVLAMHFAPWLTQRLPRLRFLEDMGSAALPVFCAHLVLALLLLAFTGDSRDTRPWSVDAVIVGASLLLLYGVAWSTLWLDRRTAAARARLREQTSQRIIALGRRRAGVPR